jgi:TonB family protein
MPLARSVFLILAIALIAPVAIAADKTIAVWSDGHSSPITDEELLRYAVASPPAPYPEEAQQKNLTGNGVYELRIDKTGKTIGVAILRSAGSPVLDRGATSAFGKWRFKPGIFTKIRIPVSWSVNRIR